MEEETEITLLAAMKGWGLDRYGCVRFCLWTGDFPCLLHMMKGVDMSSLITVYNLTNILVQQIFFLCPDFLTVQQHFSMLWEHVGKKLKREIMNVSYTPCCQDGYLSSLKESILKRKGNAEVDWEINLMGKPSFLVCLCDWQQKAREYWNVLCAELQNPAFLYRPLE